LLTSVFVDPRERGTALGAWAAVGAVGATLGNVIGGLLTSAGGWRWIFLVNVPVCALAFAAAFVLVPSLPRPGRRRLGLPSAVLAMVGVGGLLLGLAELQAGGPGPVAAVVLVIAAAAVGTFVAVQARSADPLLPLSLFRQRTAIAFVLMLVGAGCGIGSYYTASLYMQETLRWSALAAGVAFVPWAALTAVVAQVASRSLHRVGPRLIVAPALLCAGAGAAVLAVGLDPQGSYGALLPAFLLLGAGTGAAGVSCTVTAMSGIPRARHGVGAGALNSTQAVGSAVAIAVVTLLSSVAGGAGGGPQHDVLAGQRFALLVVAGLGLAGAAVALLLPRRVPAPGPADPIVLARPVADPMA
jgi:MFS family permease